MPIPAGSSPAPASPSGPLYYDPVLSRVRLNVTGLPTPVSDAFARTVSNGWGTATSGQVWAVSGAAVAQFSVNGVGGVHAVSAVFPTVFRSVLAVSVRDFRLRLPTMLWPIAPTGDHVRTEVLVRYVDANNYVRLMALINVGNLVDLQVESVVAGVATQLAAVSTGVTHSAGVSLGVKAELIGSTIRASVWKDGTAEPTTWQAEVSDPNPQAGDVGILSLAAPSNTNTKPFNAVYDELTVTPLALVERSADLVRWSTVRGGESVVLAAGTLRLDDYEFAADVANYYRMPGYSGSIIPVLGGVWLKSVARPFLNRQVTVADFSEVTRPNRGGVFEVVGRSYPVAVTDVRGSRRWSLQVRTDDPQEANDLDLLLAGGDILLVHVPQGGGRISAVPGGYVTVGDTRMVTPPTYDLRMRVLDLPLVEVAAPGPDVVGASVTVQTVLNAYATCQQVLDAHPTVLDLLELVGSPTDVIVP